MKLTHALKAGFFILLVTLWSLCSQPATAMSKAESMRGDTDERSATVDPADNNWHVSVGGATGVTMDGLTYSIMDAIVEIPEDAPPFFQLLPSRSWHRYVATPAGNEINITRFEYPFGDSNNFFGSAYRDADNVGVGVTYVPEHWGQDWLDGISFSGYIPLNPKGSYIFAVDSDYPVADGYGIEVHGLYYFGVNDNGEYTKRNAAGKTLPVSPNRLNGTIGFYHNFVPDGSLRGEFGYAAWTSLDDDMSLNECFWYFTIKGTL